MLDSWKQWVASGWEGRVIGVIGVIGVGGRERVGFMAAATHTQSDRKSTRMSDRK